jgi:predicted HTH transcriptional regulator
VAVRGISVEEALQLGRETKHLEFKASGSLDHTGLKLKVIRAMLAMANNQDGGTVIVGIKDNGEACECLEANAKTWTSIVQRLHLFRTER